MIPFELSTNLGHTWFFDLDGTIFKHDGRWEDGYDTVLPGVKELWDTIPLDDMIIISTARREMWRDEVIATLKKNDLRYDYLLFNLRHGERIIVNDEKPNGLQTAIAWNVKRNRGF
jgi:hypothetical protein